MNATLKLATIEELKKERFLIPSYQRGYRWTDKEIIELLNDIDTFTPESIAESTDKTWYCLQPIVVKDNNGIYEVIDGQQRLTTIYLILHYLNSTFSDAHKSKLFEIDYATRKKVPNFLSNLKQGEVNQDNIDFHYITEAYNTICNWFERENFNLFDFLSKFNFNTKVIWYECNDDAISIFTRINMGKIPLTNSELIKALFLNSSNFGKNFEEKVRLKQLEISSEWDRIEHALHDDSFWYFISEEEVLTNRIDYIFRLMNPKKDLDDIYATFRYFSEKFENKTKDTIEQNWLEVKNYFQTLQEWYSERDIYHKVGFLVSENESIEELVKKSIKMKKDMFKNYLDSQIKSLIKNVDIDDLQYGDKKLKTVLLLYNIETMLQNDTVNSKFPFDLYKKEKWDIEHITSIKDAMPEQKTQKKQWLKDSVEFIDVEEEKGKVLKSKAEQYLVDDNYDNFNDIYDEITDYFNEFVNSSDINDISNLALLDSSTNRGYKNAVFPVKRMTIIKKEKSGKFIPICTKNAFLKYFSEYPPKMSFWTQEDNDKYLKDIQTVLSNYI